MKKKIISMLLILSCFSFSKNKIKNTTGLAVKPEFNISNDYRKDITPSGTETISQGKIFFFSWIFREKMEYCIYWRNDSF